LAARASDTVVGSIRGPGSSSLAAAELLGRALTTMQT
jgi:hypothetical protein